LLFKIKQQNPDIPLTLVMDNALLPKVQQGDGASQGAGHRHPFPAPLLAQFDLIERLWKFTKKKCLTISINETFCHSRRPCDECLEKVKSSFSEQVKTL